MSNDKEWKSLLGGVKFVASLVVGLLLVGMLIPESEPVSHEDFINASHPIGKKLMEVNHKVTSTYGLDDTTLLFANPTGDPQGLYTSRGKTYTDRARKGQFFDRVSHPELGQTGTQSIERGHRLCLTWAGRHGEYDLLIKRLLADQPVNDGSANSVMHHLVAFHELGHCIRSPAQFREYAISNDELKERVRQVIDVDDEILDSYFTYGKGMSLHQRYLGETMADMIAVEAMIHQAGYDRDDVMNTLMSSRWKRHHPGHIEYASTLSLVAMFYYDRENVFKHPIQVMNAMVEEDPLLELDTIIIGTIAHRSKGEYRVKDPIAYAEAKDFFAVRRMHWHEWKDHLRL